MKKLKKKRFVEKRHETNGAGGTDLGSQQPPATFSSADVTIAPAPVCTEGLSDLGRFHPRYFAAAGAVVLAEVSQSPFSAGGLGPTLAIYSGPPGTKGTMATLISP